MTTQTPAGWYPDPYGSPQLRWWDGNQWTDATHPTDAPAGQDAAPAPQTGPSSPPAGTAPQGMAAPGTAPQGMAAPGTAPQSAVPQAVSVPPQGGTTAQFQQPQWGGAPGGMPAGPVGPGGAGGASQPPVQGYGAPAGHPAPAGSGKSRLPWILGGAGAVVLVAVIVVAAVFLVGADRTSTASSPTTRPSASATTQQPTPTPTPTPTPDLTTSPVPPPAQLPQPDGGRITDPVTGLSYDSPDDRWQVPQVNAPGPLGLTWTSGVVTMSHEDYDDKGSDWLGNIYTAELPDGFDYSGAESMKGTLATLLHAIEPVYYEPQHARDVVEDKALTIGGRPARQLTLELDFSRSSELYGWKWKKERVTFVLVDRGAGKRPALLYMSVPDNLDFSVTERVLKSLKIK
ncbi:DUF2510 domain-containing protein [Planomonospora venezuelensis]|uniref:DUF2510 domain-containing protein n=1 Tax=Planomonospora venezuelensis TaxID=1999 RepID=A0A841CYE0_PLAVE|nr:DUF2510 domain-containing protein [Planomonospora venezuelensis]MBB5962319.1 hypothetical protein [Planomonospora venezuelensis]